MKSLSELRSEEVIRGVSEDEGREAGVRPLDDDGSPVVDPVLDEVQIVAADEAQQRMSAGQRAAERRTRLAALGFDFGLGGGRRGEQGSLSKRTRSMTRSGGTETIGNRFERRYLLRMTDGLWSPRRVVER